MHIATDEKLLQELEGNLSSKLLKVLWVMPGFLFLWTFLFAVPASFLMKGTQPLLHVAKSFLCALLLASLTSISSTHSERVSDSLRLVLAPAFGLDECDIHPTRAWQQYRAARWETGTMLGIDSYNGSTC